MLDILIPVAQPLTLNEIFSMVEEKSLKGLRLQCEKPLGVRICMKSDLQNNVEFRELEIKDVYNERYLLANSVDDSRCIVLSLFVYK